MYIVGGHGYVGSRTASFAATEGAEVTVVSRDGDTRHGTSSLAWPDFLADVRAAAGRRASIVWSLNGARNGELDLLTELLSVADEATYIVAVSTCTVYGNRHGQTCDEATPLSLVTANAKLKAACADALEASAVSYGVLRLGTLYGTDHRGVRDDRIEKWIIEAAHQGTVTVPEPAHWRGWLHLDQAARALFRAADGRVEGTFNVTSSNYRFGEAASFAAAPLGAAVVSDEQDDPMDYKIDSTKAVQRHLLDQLDGEDLPSAVAALVDTYTTR
jgi:nucleoside-diphosphate-sugar epimerase